MKDKVKQELQRLEDEHVIAKVTEPTDWVSPIVIVTKKDGSLRICLDPRRLNEAIKCPHYQMPAFETLLSKRHGSTVYTLLDASHAFHHMQLDDASSRLCTFTTPFGRFRFLVMPFGLSRAPEMFQQAMDQVFASEENINPYFDDILIASKSVPDHCKQLRQVLEKARCSNLKFNKDKLKLAVSEVNYPGHVLTAKGIQPDDAKLKAIAQYPEPTNRQDLQHFLGMATYLTKFAPQLAQRTHQLRQLLRKDTPWIWDANTQKCFEEVKKSLS